jgi:hypothetical protein
MTSTRGRTGQVASGWDQEDETREIKDKDPGTSLRRLPKKIELHPLAGTSLKTEASQQTSKGSLWDEHGAHTGSSWLIPDYRSPSCVTPFLPSLGGVLPAQGTECNLGLRENVQCHSWFHFLSAPLFSKQLATHPTPPRCPRSWQEPEDSEIHGWGYMTPPNLFWALQKAAGKILELWLPLKHKNKIK